MPLRYGGGEVNVGIAPEGLMTTVWRSAAGDPDAPCYQTATMRPALLAAIALVPALAACQTAPDGAYPSLAIRDVERAQGQLEPVPGDPIDVPPVEVPLDGPLDQRLAALVEQGRSAHARFTEAAPRASRLASAASNSGVGSDAWASAQVALADLDSIRSEAAIALADLDLLFIAGSVEANGTAAIANARQTLLALIQEEDRTLADLRARVR